jgi:hypothetical protein
VDASSNVSIAASLGRQPRSDEDDDEEDEEVEDDEEDEEEDEEVEDDEENEVEESLLPPASLSWPDDDDDDDDDDEDEEEEDDDDDDEGQDGSRTRRLPNLSTPAPAGRGGDSSGVSAGPLPRTTTRGPTPPLHSTMRESTHTVRVAPGGTRGMADGSDA